MKRTFGAAFVAAIVFAWAGAANAASWFYFYGPLYQNQQGNYPPAGTPVIETVTSAPPNTTDIIFITRVSNFAVEAIRISNALPGDVVQLGTSVGSLDFLGQIGSDGTFSWNGSLSPTSHAWDITFFHLNVGVFSDGHLVRNDSFNLDELTFTGYVPSPVPEPAIWAMMIAGFGLAGGAIRRRRGAMVPA